MSPTRWTDNGSVRIHYLDSDDAGTAPPIVFVPGLTDVAEDYLPILGQFDRRLIVIDLRGRGRSDAPVEGYTLDDHAGDIAAVVDEVTDGPVHVMTFSRGTCYALAWATQFPDRVRSVAIGDYPAREVRFPEDLSDRFMASNWRGTPVADRLSATAMAGIVSDAVGRTFWVELGAMGVPVLVVRGRGRTPLTESDWLDYGEIPGVEQVDFEDSGHDIFEPDPSRYPRLVKEHADRADAAIR